MRKLLSRSPGWSTFYETVLASIRGAPSSNRTIRRMNVVYGKAAALINDTKSGGYFYHPTGGRLSRVLIEVTLIANESRSRSRRIQLPCSAVQRV